MEEQLGTSEGGGGTSDSGHYTHVWCAFFVDSSHQAVSVFILLMLLFILCLFFKMSVSLCDNYWVL